MFVLGHRPALDGIRGIAIILVVLSHTAWSAADGGGFVGVSLFFVLSGFLITTLLVDEHRRSGRIDLPAFYRRRALRLLPAVVLVAVAAAGYMAATGRLEEGLRNSAATLFYVANLLAASGTPMPFIEHTWSLAMEEQFYVLWPLALVLLFRTRTAFRWIVFGLLGLAVASAVLRYALWEAGAAAERLHYGPDTRADAILAGCLLALVIARRPGRLGFGSLTFGAACLLAALTVCTDPDDAYAYGLLLITVGAPAFIAWAVLSPAGQHAWLEHPALTRVGRLSYGLYLWHYPILLGGDSLLPFVPQPLQTLLLIAASWVAAELSWRFVETPFNRRRRSSGTALDQADDVSARPLRPSPGAPSSAR